MDIIIQKVDLDTCLTAFILGVSEKDNIIVIPHEAEDKLLKDPSIICIEAGGSGLTELNNFDHHDPERYFPPACRQAYEVRQKEDRILERLIEYVCMVDERPKDHPNIPFPSLSNIFSGMLLLEKDPKAQLFKGMSILSKVIQDNIDPFSTMPDVPEWQEYKRIKEENIKKLEKVLKDARFYTSHSNMKVGFLKSTIIGGIGSLYQAGCDVVIMFNPSFGNPPVSKYTIAGNTKKVVHLLQHFDKIEKGWGGRERIIGSPRSGSNLTEKEVIEIVLKHL
ncbi:MAG TPA: hypothetical protein PKZ54_10420 [Syntrophorhabdaceae bacterium]|nr:hypothetical protein [Syntrophorhabdaceae bacterium]